MNMTSVYIRIKVGHSDIYFIDFVFFYIIRNGPLGVFVPHWAIALVKTVHPLLDDMVNPSL